MFVVLALTKICIHQIKRSHVHFSSSTEGHTSGKKINSPTNKNVKEQLKNGNMKRQHSLNNLLLSLYGIVCWFGPTRFPFLPGCKVSYVQ